MCGIAGLINEYNINENYLLEINNSLINRGPDHHDMWIDKRRNFCFLHTRLSILDLSSRGNQPMRSQSDNILITFNGEIYNHLEIRNKINKIKSNFNWKSSSDTETVLESIDLWGIEETLKILDGMFAFCIFDYKKNNFFLARDKFGEKPLYYGFNNNVFLFSSDLNFLKKHNSFKKELDYDAIKYFLRLSYIPSPYSIFKDFKKLLPGSYLKVSNSDMTTELVSYWTVEDNLNNQPYKNNYSEEEYIDNCDNILKKNIVTRTLSDVPIGAFLSSGVDSALIASLIKYYTKKNLNTFTLGYKDYDNDETKYAELISKRLNTDHNEFKVSFENIFDVVEDIPKIYSEPFADSSQIPTVLISKFAKKKVSVVLTGDGGDEIFGGYNRHIWITKLNKISKINKKIILFLLNNLRNLNFLGIKNEELILKLNKLMTILKSNDVNEMYLSSIFSDYEDDLFGNDNQKFNKLFNLDNLIDKNLKDEEKMMVLDTKFYLSDDILCKVDRASMSCSLESRAPFLSQELFDFGKFLPSKYKISKITNKYLLRKVLENYLPKNLISNQKKGFSLPLGYWMRNKLKQWSYNSIFEKNSFSSQNFNITLLNKIWSEHQSGKVDRSKILWNIIILNNWIKEWRI